MSINNRIRWSDSETRWRARAQMLLLHNADMLLLILLTLAAVWTLLHYNIRQQPIPGDTTYHIYAAQQMLEGHPIYLDVAIIKTPLADFFTLLALPIGRLIGITDTFAARVLFLLVALCAIGFTYLAGRVLFDSYLVGLIAALIVAGNNFYDIRALTGPEPKSLVMVFALASCIFIARRRWGLAGISAGLAALAWQPAALMMAIAFGAALFAPAPDNPARARRRAIVRVVGGMSVPFVPLLVYLGLNHALVPAFDATFGANLFHLNNETQTGSWRALISYNLYWIAHNVGLYCLAMPEHWQLGAGALGFVGILANEGLVARRTNQLPLNLQRTPFLLYTFGFAAFTLIDFNFCPDLFPLLPSLALAIGWLVKAFVQGVYGLMQHWLNLRLATRLTLGIAVVIVLLVACMGLLDSRRYQLVGLTYKNQMNLVRKAQAFLKPGGSILALGNAILLTELHQDNASNIIHFGEKSGEGVLNYEPGGLDAMVDGLAQNPPRLISLSRTEEEDWNRDFYTWLYANYRLVEINQLNQVQLYILKKHPTQPTPKNQG